MKLEVARTNGHTRQGFTDIKVVDSLIIRYDQSGIHEKISPRRKKKKGRSRSARSRSRSRSRSRKRKQKTRTTAALSNAKVEPIELSDSPSKTSNVSFLAPNYFDTR